MDGLANGTCVHTYGHVQHGGKVPRPLRTGISAYDVWVSGKFRKSLVESCLQAIIVVNASMTHVSPYYVNSGDTSGAWKCVAVTHL